MQKHYVVMLQFSKTGFLQTEGKSYFCFNLADSEQQAVNNAIAVARKMSEYRGFTISSVIAEIVPIQVCPYNAGQTAIHLGNYPDLSQGIFIRTDLPNPAPSNLKKEFEYFIARHFSAISGIRWS